MIKSFKHKGLEQFYETGSKKGIKPSHAKKLKRILDVLEASTKPTDMDLPGYDLHDLHGEDEGTWSVNVNGNWRVTFSFEDAQAIKVNYLDYH